MNQKQLTPDDVVYAIGGEAMLTNIAVAMLAKSSVTELLQNFSTVRVGFTKNYILHSAKGEDENGVDCEVQLLILTLFGRATGVASTRIIWGNHPPKSRFYPDIGDAVVSYCIVVNNMTATSLRRMLE